MKFKKYQNIMRVCSLVLLFSFQFSFACGGWDVPAEVNRLSIFNAKRTEFFPGLSKFYYSGDNYYKEFIDFDTEWKLNCLEWKQQLGGKVKSKDVYTVLYETEDDSFVKAYKTKSLHKVFKNNTFIKVLLLLKNKAYLEYLLEVKNQEYNNTAWNADNNKKDVEYYKNKISNAKKGFLKQRYAYLLLRDSWQCSQEEACYYYDTYFKNKKTILEKSALYYKVTHYRDDYVFKDYEASEIFMHCGDKAFKFYNENHIGLGMEYLRNPGPCLEGIRKMAKLSPNNVLLSFLIRREINKIEDWILTPKYTNEEPAVSLRSYSDWYGDFEIAKQKNYTKDILYLRELRSFLISFRRKTSGEQSDFIACAIAQLCFIDDEVDLEKKYTNLISDKANASILAQKNIQLALITLKKSDLKNKEVQNRLFKYFNSIENLNKNDDGLPKNLYSLYRLASKEFSKQENQAVAGLFYIKAEIAKLKDADDEYYKNYALGHYDYLGYFERHATIKEVDYLITLNQKLNKTPFEKFISANVLSPDVNLYKDLKGTIAFRNNDLQLAYKVFASMPSNFWTKNYSFADLNEDPFVPKALVKTQDRKLNYHFNKADFIKKLIKLKKQNTAESYLQLANAYYNVSYFGNSWMMVSYDRFNLNNSNPYFTYCDDNQKLKAKYQNGNYYELTIAKMYYQKALEIAKTNEEKTLASLMIFRCKYDRYNFSGFNSYESDYFPFSNETHDKFPFYYTFIYVPNYNLSLKKEFKGIQELVNFYSVYKSTETFKKYDCPLLREFIN